MSPQPRDGTAVISSRSELEGMAHEWDVLAESIGVPMLSHAWITSCAEDLYDADQLHVIAVRNGGKLAGIAPLVRREHAGITRLELIGVSELFEPSGLLYDTGETLDVLLRAIVNSRRPVLLSRIPTQSPIAPHLRSFVRRPGVLLLKPGAGTVSIPISLGWSEFLGRASSRLRYDLRRARRRAEEAGNVMASISRPRPEEVAALFDKLVTVEANGWKARNGSSLHQQHKLRQFFLNYATRAAHQRMAQFGFLDVNGQAIAAQLSVVYAERLWVLKIGYDETWSRCSPGWLLLSETMRDAFDLKLKSYEFLGIDEAWLHRWDTQSTSFSTAACYPASALGLYCLMADTSARIMLKASSMFSNLVGI